MKSKLALLAVLPCLMSTNLANAESCSIGSTSEPCGNQSVLANALGATPYEKLKNIYESAAPMPLSQLPTLDKSNAWSCAGVLFADPTNIVDFDSSTLGAVPVQVHGKIVVTPAAPADGPLFREPPKLINGSTLWSRFPILEKSGLILHIMRPY